MSSCVSIIEKLATKIVTSPRLQPGHPNETTDYMKQKIISNRANADSTMKTAFLGEKPNSKPRFSKYVTFVVVKHCLGCGRLTQDGSFENHETIYRDKADRYLG